jgi:DNA uptake protein ComE-like DNA-binding protein
MFVLLVACATPVPAPVSPPAAPVPPPAPVEAPAPPPAPVPAAAAKLDVNTATAEQLATVPNVGKKMIHEFEEYRPYVSIAQFRKEIGKYVSAEEVAAYEKFLYVPIDPAKADAATLQQIGGLDEAEAAAVVSGRPYADRAAFLAKIQPMLTPEELAAGSALLVP